jgi:DNA polymerase-4
VCRTVVLRLRFDDFTRATRSRTMFEATASTHVILGTARGLLTDALPMIEKRGITLIGLALSNLDDDTPLQLPLPFAGDGGGALDAALDNLRDRFGSRAITRAVLLGRDDGLAVPHLPD